jgi:polysaccharide pyruvyl transferase WcaK-like protein
MEREPKLVGLFGLFGIGNSGNDGSLESMVRFLRRAAPQEGLLCICGDPAVVEKAFGLDAVSIYNMPRRWIGGRAGVVLQKAAGRATLWLHAWRHLRRLKVLIVPGMGVLDDFAVSPLGWPHDILSWCVLGRLMGVKVIFVSIGAGPIRHPLSRWFMKAAARAAHYRSYRDTVSKAFMESIGFDARQDAIYPDIAFALPPPASTRPQGGESWPLTIGVGVMAYHGWHNDRTRGAAIYAAYLQKMTSFLVWLLDQGHGVRLLMGDDADRRAIDDLLRAIRSRRTDLAEDAIVFAPAYTLHDVMQQMADSDLVVATRYHNIVCALRMDKPTISIGYADKNDALLAQMGLSDFCQHIERLDVHLLEMQTTRLMSDRAAFERRIREMRTRFESKLREQEGLLTSLIFPSPDGRTLRRKRFGSGFFSAFTRRRTERGTFGSIVGDPLPPDRA